MHQLFTVVPRDVHAQFPQHLLLLSPFLLDLLVHLLDAQLGFIHFGLVILEPLQTLLVQIGPDHPTEFGVKVICFGAHLSLCLFGCLPFLLLVFKEVLKREKAPRVSKMLGLVLSRHASIHELHFFKMQQNPLDESQSKVCLVAQVILFLLFLLLIAYWLRGGLEGLTQLDLGFFHQLLLGKWDSLDKQRILYRK